MYLHTLMSVRMLEPTGGALTYVLAYIDECTHARAYRWRPYLCTSSRTHLPTYVFTHSLAYFLTYLLANLLTYLVTNLLTHIPTHPHTYVPVTYLRTVRSCSYLQ